MLKSDLLTPRALLRKLPGSLQTKDIKKCAHQFKQRAHRHTEIEINDIDGQTVLMRAADHTTLDRDWNVLLEIVNSLISERAENETQTYFRDLATDAARSYA